LISVTLREPSRGQEKSDAVALFTWGSALYERRSIVSQGDIVATVPLAGGGHVAVVAATPLTAVVRSAARVTTQLTLPASLDQAPQHGAELGSVTYLADGQKLGTVPLVAGVTATPSPGASSR
jgi:D-alanyl-D-alanine carboxypeptidase